VCACLLNIDFNAYLVHIISTFHNKLLLDLVKQETNILTAINSFPVNDAFCITTWCQTFV